MATTSERLSLEVKADTSDATRGLKDFDRSLQSAEREMEELLKALGDGKVSGAQFEKAVADVDKRLSMAKGSFDETADRASRLDKALGDGGRSFGSYGTGLGGLGDRADEVDTRMMGLSDGIQGVSDLMRANELRPHEFAMAFSDLGSSVYNTVIPSLQGAGQAVRGLGDRFSAAGGLLDMFKRNMGTIALGAGGLAGGLVALNIILDDIAATNQAAADRARNYADALRQERRGVSDAITGAAELALVEGEVGAALEANRAKFDVLSRGVRENTDGVEQLDDKVGVFASGNAVAITEALEDAGLAGTAFGDELLRLTTNSDLTRGEVVDLIAALDAEADSMEQTGISAETAAARHQGFADKATFARRQMEINTVTAATYDEALAQIRDNVNTQVTLIAPSPFNIYKLRQYLMNQFDNIPARIRPMTSSNLRTGGRQTGGGLTFAGGGVVPEYAAHGAIVGGPRGTDTVPVWATPGEMILNDSQQANLFRALDYGIPAAALGGGGGGATYNITVDARGSLNPNSEEIRVLVARAIRSCGDMSRPLTYRGRRITT